ncbi:MAG: CPBP family intramembrane metalloprotease [Saprospiraceae bacterium]|nr:CPBP family intramembrane metalloprotease [Saprospiraceae bacterium]
MQGFELTIGLICVIIGTLLYLFDSKTVGIFKHLSARLPCDRDVWSIYSKRLIGVLWLGILPGTILMIFDINTLVFNQLFRWSLDLNAFLLLALIISILMVNYFNASRENNLAMYPQIRKRQWSVSLVIGSSITWLVYLFAYEFLFRGILLFTSLTALTEMTSITLNVSIYALFHIPKGMKETLASIPFGIILCIVTIEAGSFWIAFLLHSLLALSNEWFSIYFHPDISIINTR